MSEHSEIMTAMKAELEHMDREISILPRTLAVITYSHISTSGTSDRLVEYLTLEQLTAMARKLLGRCYSHESDETVSHQGDLFSGTLQDRYPLPRKVGRDPVYKLRNQLSQDERAWNVEQLRKSGEARMKHADALEAEGQLAA